MRLFHGVRKNNHHNHPGVARADCRPCKRDFLCRIGKMAVERVKHRLAARATSMKYRKFVVAKGEGRFMAYLEERSNDRIKRIMERKTVGNEN